VTGVTARAASLDDLHHALASGVLGLDAVCAELGGIVAGRKPGRRSDDEIIVFDSTGMALQNVAAPALVSEYAMERRRGVRVRLD
jgi:ornithine cyclodeaminase/alanine dehydrogenase-like protein (mu-crystallin family)